eukprot:723892-Ditylum_brightwellii.AAC.1
MGQDKEGKGNEEKIEEDNAKTMEQDDIIKEAEKKEKRKRVLECYIILCTQAAYSRRVTHETFLL